MEREDRETYQTLAYPDLGGAVDGGAAAEARPGTQPARLVSIFGIRMTDQPFEDALRHAGSMLAAGGRHTLFFANAHTLNLAAASKEYRSLLHRADAVFGDGTGVRWAARLRGVRLAANLNGTDLVPALLRQRPGLRCFILGSAEDRIPRIEQSFRRIFPSCDLAGAHHGYIDHEASLRVIEAINHSKADLLLVGMGNPLQERWICRYRAELEIPLVVGVGGLLEYWSGALDRAPLWMRRGGIEWIHILRRQPWKARRYLIGNLQFIWRNLLWIGADLRRQEPLQQ